MSVAIARERLTLAALMVLLSFVSSSARLLVTQSRLLRTKDALRREAKRDSLTGLWNHKAIIEILERELLRSERDRQPVGVIMTDVDHFKNVNDSRGHAAGDAVLRIIASGIAAMVRPYDSVGRYGGEEFLIVAPGCGLGETWELAERVRAHIASCSIMAGGSAVQVTLSLGVATGEAIADLEKSLHAADSAMVAKTHYLWGAPAPLVLRGPSGGYVHGGPFHSQNPEMWFVHNPGLKVICPATPYDAKGLIKSAIRDNNPCIFFEHKYLYRRIKEEVPADDYVVPIGKARVAREGKDLSIITYAAMVHTALEAAEILNKEGIDIEIVDLRSLAPIDREAITQTVKKTNKVIILHEHSRTGGIAGEIAAIINEEAFDDLDGPIVRIAGLDSAVPFSPPQEHHYLPKLEDIVRESRRLKAY